ncbi:cleavage stimulating factor 64 isoform X2 [Salvia miltiorrhiza]|uniref:cleavage stimulating factor 64 isoform X2 n=1 Tax=Salvia miltiorrhiza TaxID=226208 RepID=UPI0025AC1399|nr:cleavage stimulating factor 64 isoform X2 [Salvia miltiorrhiza]
MAGKQISGDGVPPSLAGMSKNQLYDIMCQMKALIEQNKQQARQILIQNPALTKALFQAQIMLGMVQSSQASPAISSAVSQNPQPSAISNQQPTIQAAAPVSGPIGQNQIRKQQLNQPMASHPPSQPHPPPNPQPQSMPSHPLHQTQQPKGHISAQSMPMSVPQPSQVSSLTQLPQHTASQSPSLHHLPMPSLLTQSQQPLPNTGSQYLPLQPPLPPQPRPPMPGFPHQAQAQMGPNPGFQHPSGPQMHHSQHMFHSGSKPPSGMGPSFPQGQLPLPNQPLSQSMYQAGSPHLGMDFNQVGSSKQTDRGSNWIPGLPENTMGQLLGPQPGFPGQAGPSNQLPRPPSLTPEFEKALLQQVMSLTPEQINMLPAEQRNQVLHLQQMLRQ